MNRIGMSSPGDSGFLKFTAALLAVAALASWSAGAGNPNHSGGRITVGSSGVIRWEADAPASIYVATDGGPEVLMAEAARGEEKPEWPHAGHVYRFVLRNTGDGRWLHSVTAEKDAYGGWWSHGKHCGRGTACRWPPSCWPPGSWLPASPTGAAWTFTRWFSSLPH
jgi:hypothetical protein